MTRRPRRGVIRLVEVIAVLGQSALTACAGLPSSPPSVTEGAGATRELHSGQQPQDPGPASLRLARSHPLARLAGETLGPFWSASGARKLAAWVGDDPYGRAAVFAVVAGNDGALLGPTRVIARPKGPITSLEVHSAGPQGGWLLVFGTIADQGEALSALLIGPDGESRSAASVIRSTVDHIPWVRLLSPSEAGRGILCLWVEEDATGGAALLCARLDSNGLVRSVPLRVAENVLRWQAAAGPQSIAVAVLSSISSSSGDSSVLRWLQLDGGGRLRGPGVVVAPGRSVGGDVELANIPDGWVLAWTDGTAPGPAVSCALVKSSGALLGPRRLTPERSSLVGVASASGGALIAWTQRDIGTVSTTRFARVSAEGATITMRPGPDILQNLSPGWSALTASGDGFALLGAARACPSNAPLDECDGPVAPTFIRLGSDLKVKQVEPLFIPDQGPAALAWGLRCTSDSHCSALAAGNQTPVPVFAYDLPPRTSRFAPPLVAVSRPRSARLLGIATVATGRVFEAVSAARVGSSTVVAAMAPSAARLHRAWRAQPARVDCLTIDGQGAQIGSPVPLTLDASPVGGIAMAAGGSPADGLAIGWVTSSPGARVQLIGLALSPAGRMGRIVHRATFGDGRASALALAWAGDGWLVAWAGARNAPGQVFATKINRQLHRTAPIQRVLRTPSQISDLTLAVDGQTAWLSWSDPRDDPANGIADIFAVTLRAEDASRSGSDLRVLATPDHSRSPALAALANGTSLIAWIEDPGPESQERSSVMLACLDASGRVSCGPGRLRLPARTQPTTVALAPSPSGKQARLAVAVSGPDGAAIDALNIGPHLAALGPAWPLATLDAPAFFEPAVAIAGDGILFVDIGPIPGARRIRRASVTWANEATAGRQDVGRNEQLFRQAGR